MLWPRDSIHFKNSMRTAFFAGSSILSGTRSQVKLEIGYVSLPGALLIETRKSAGIVVETADAAAAMFGKPGLANTPAELRTRPKGSLC